MERARARAARRSDDEVRQVRERRRARQPVGRGGRIPTRKKKKSERRVIRQ